MALLDDIARGPSTPNPLAQLAGVQQLQGQQQIQQQRAVQIQGDQTDNGLKSLALASGQQSSQDQKDIRAAYAASTDPQTGQVDRPTLLSTLAKLNPTVAAQTASGLTTQDNAAKDAALKTQDLQVAAAQSHLKLKDQLLQGASAATWPNTRAIAIQNGINPQEVPEQYPGDAWVAQAHAQTMTQQQTLEAHLNQQKADETKSHDIADEANTAAQRAETAKKDTSEAAYQRGELAVQQGKLSLDKQKQSVEQGGSIEAMAQQIASGDVKKPTVTRNNPFNEAVLKRAYEINPNLTDEAYTTKQDFLSSKGKANLQVQSLNKLSAHLDELQSASGNAGFSPVGFTAAGKDLRLAEQLFSKEDVKFLSGAGVGTEGELNGLIEKIHSPVQSVRDSAIDTLSKFTSDAARQLGDQYERGTKQKFDPNQHFTPTTVSMMQKHGGTSARPQASGQIVVTAPDGSQHPFENQAQADKFKALAGIK